MKREDAEDGVILRQAKELVGLPEARRGKEDPVLEISEGAWRANTVTSGFEPPEL